ncbi:hypothetical protein IV203_012743 [Nitzschia inconspicua]|uniref:Uncharacterized protein n=1 Tax=Nitzschia inconspicua TaxID=303405 RepID=A0A9K3K9F7_9STRA|nr:hypothetical protein IV203_012743 [Nitzschia inconspicua]
MKYKNFGSIVAASSSNTSSQGNNNYPNGQHSQHHSQHSTRTTATTHRSSDRKTETTMTNDDDEDELISVSQSYSGNGDDENGTKQVRGILQQKRHSQRRAKSKKKQSHQEQEEEEDPYHQVFEDDYRLAEEREPSSSRSRANNYYDDTGSMNTNQTPNTVTSSSRRAKKLAYVAYVPVHNDNSNSNHQQQATMIQNQKDYVPASRQKKHHQQQQNVSSHYSQATGGTSYPSLKMEDTSTSRQRQIASAMRIQEEDNDDDQTPIPVEEEEEEEDCEVAAIMQVISGTSSTQVAMSREYSPDESKSGSGIPEKKQKKQTVGMSSLSIHTMDEQPPVDDLSAVESRNLRRQRLAKRYLKGTSPASGEAALATVKSNTTASGKKHQPSDQQAPLSPLASPETPTANNDKNNKSGMSPTSPAYRASKLSRIMRKAQQNQRAIAGQIAATQQQQPQVYPFQQHILHEVDGMNAAIVHAARMARSESENAEPKSPRSPQRFNTLLGLSPKPREEAPAVQQLQQQQLPRVSAGLSPHRQRQQQHIGGAGTAALRKPMSFPDSITPPSLAANAPYPSTSHPYPQQHQLHPSTRGPQTHNSYQPHQQHMMHQQQNYHFPGHEHQHGSGRTDQQSFNHHFRQQPQPMQSQVQVPSFGTGNRVRASAAQEYHHHQYYSGQQQQQYRMAPAGTGEEQSAVAGTVSPASMHIASSEWTAAVEENQDMMFCGPEGPRLKNVHFVRGGNGLSKNPCDPIGLKCQSIVSNLVSTCATLSGNAYYHTESKRSQFEKAAEQSISNLTAGFLDHDFSKTLSPHWQNYGAYFSQETGKSSAYQSSYEEEEDYAGVADGAVASAEEAGPKDEFDVNDDSFAANARRLFQKGNDIMGTFPTEFQNLTQSASNGVFGGGMMAGTDQGAFMVQDVKNLFDTFQRYYEPEEMIYEDKEDFQHSSVHLPVHHSAAYNGPSYQPYSMPVPPKHGLVGEYQQGNAQAPVQIGSPPSKEQENTTTQEKLDVLTGIRRRRHKVFPFNAPSPQNPADAANPQQETSSAKEDPAIQISYDKTRVRCFYRDLNDRIHKDESPIRRKPVEDKTAKKEADTIALKEEDSAPIAEKSIEPVDEVKITKEVRDDTLSPKSILSKDLVDDNEKKVYCKEKVYNKDPVVCNDDSNLNFVEAQQSAQSSTDHSRSTSRRSEESMLSFHSAQHCASITQHEMLHHLSVESFEEEGKINAFQSAESESEDGKGHDAKHCFDRAQPNQVLGGDEAKEEIFDSKLDTELDAQEDDDQMMPPSPSPSDESLDLPKNNESHYSPTIVESSSLQNTFSLPNQYTARSLETCNTDDLVMAFLTPAEDDNRPQGEEKEGESRENAMDSSSSPSGTEPSNEQLATYMNLSSGMSDSLVGSDMSEGSPSTTNSFSEPVAEEMDYFEESPMSFCQHELLELDEQEADELAMSDPNVGHSESSSFEHTEFPHTPLDVIEEEASNADELDSVVQLQRYNSNEFPQPVNSDDEDVDIFSLQQNTATQDSHSTGEADDDYYYTQEDMTEWEKEESSAEEAVHSERNLAAGTLLLQKQRGDGSGTTSGPPANAPSQRETPMSNDDWQELNRLVADALKSPTQAKTNKTPSIPLVPTRIPKNEWQQELEEALEDDELLHRVKTMLQHDPARHGRTAAAAAAAKDEYELIEEEELEQELMELRMSRQTKPETIDEQEKQDDQDTNDV